MNMHGGILSPVEKKGQQGVALNIKKVRTDGIIGHAVYKHLQMFYAGNGEYQQYHRNYKERCTNEYIENDLQ